MCLRHCGWSAGISDVPDDFGAVVGDEEGSVFGDGDADRATPDLAIGGDEAGEEVFVLAGCVTVFQEPCSATKPSPWKLEGNCLPL